MSAGASEELWERWIGLWNGNLDLADQIIHPDLEVHRVPMPHVPEGLGGREALVEWVKQTRSILEGLRFTVEVGPVLDGEFVAGRWFAEGSYQGGIPGATAPVGTRVGFHGNDIWRGEEGFIREILAERRPARSIATIGRWRRRLIEKVPDLWRPTRVWTVRSAPRCGPGSVPRPGTPHELPPGDRRTTEGAASQSHRSNTSSQRRQDETVHRKDALQGCA